MREHKEGPRPLSQTEVIDLMESSETEEEWEQNADLVRETNGGEYPGFWMQAIMLSGVAEHASKKWRKE